MQQDFVIEQTNNPADVELIRQMRVDIWKEWASLNPCNEQQLLTEINDELDSRSMHWVAKINKQIVGSARLSLLHSFNEIQYLKDYLPQFNLPGQKPFFYYSRLAV